MGEQFPPADGQRRDGRSACGRSTSRIGCGCACWASGSVGLALNIQLPAFDGPTRAADSNCPGIPGRDGGPAAPPLRRPSEPVAGKEDE